MRHTFIHLFLCLSALLAVLSVVLTARADDGDWRIYAAYHDARQVVAIHQRVYVMSDGGLYSYDPEDTSVETYDKAGALSDFGIMAILPSEETNELVVVYTNGNVDLLDAAGQAFNMPDLKLKSLSDKTINEAVVAGKSLFLSTNSGIVCVDLASHTFGNFYQLGHSILRLKVTADALYATTSSGVYMGRLDNNLLDPGQWMLISASEAAKVSNTLQVGVSNHAQLGGTDWRACGSEGLKGFASSASDAAETVSGIIPQSPIRNYSYKLLMTDQQRLLVAGGNFYYPEVEYTGTAMKYENGTWTAFDESEPIALVGASYYHNVTDIVQDPNDSEHHFLGTKRSGIYEFQDYKLVNHFSYDNSPLQSILPDLPTAGAYVRVTSLAYDPAGNLWMTNNQCDTIVRILTADRRWTSIYIPEVEGYPTFDHTVFDSRGWAWINSRRSTASHSAGLLVIDTNGTLSTTADDTHRFITTFSNQDGTSYSPTLFTCMAEDLDGAMWVGCNRGVFVSFDPRQVFNSDFYFTQIKVARNDGSNLADYLLSEVPVKCITVDGGNRKWIGTSGSGVFLVSADGQQTIHHFTTENSPLISDDINDIAINGETGEVFIATSAGLLSYRSDAFDPEPSFDKKLVKVYPNPVRPDYDGTVTITGLMYNSDVKIVNAAGRLVNQGTSIGGAYTWNGRLAGGGRCASGIYYVLATDEEGHKGVVSKFLIVKQ